MKCAVLSASLAVLFGCTPAKEQRIEVAPIDLKAEIDGNRIMLFYSVEPGKNICVNGHGLLPTPLDTYPDHGAEGKVVKVSANRSNVLKSYFSRDGSIASLEIWRNNGASSIETPESTRDQYYSGSIELSIEMSQCSDLFLNKKNIDQYIFYKNITISPPSRK